jgi:hypothetical protein
MELRNITILEKESLPQINFTTEDVLDSDARKRLRNIYLKKAEILGNTYKGKVKMFFKTDQNEIMAVETTIWFVNESNILLKGGINIPTKSIIAVEF